MNSPGAGAHSGSLHTRLAPTPSGYLHAGNAWSFVITWCLARKRSGAVALRVDDFDPPRYRESYLRDILESLHWLGLDYDEGPRSQPEFHASYGFQRRLPRYLDALESLSRITVEGAPAVYACDCSRKQMQEQGGCRCREKNLDLHSDGVAWRLHSPPGETVSFREWGEGEKAAEVHVVAGDFGVRQRDGLPAYHLCSVVDDEDLRMNCIVRGRDLLPSTFAQLLLARRLSLTGFPSCDFVHHGLILEKGGDKLSKSAGSRALQDWRNRGDSPARLLQWFFQQFPEGGGGKTRKGGQVGDILSVFDPERIPRQDLSWEDLEAHLIP